MKSLGVVTRYFEKRSQLLNPQEWLLNALGYSPSHAGVNVTEQNAIQSTAVYACVRLLSGTIASLPLPVYQKLEPKGKKRAPEHPIYTLLHDRPNPEISSFRWRQTGVAHQLLWGDEYNEMEYDNFGNLVSLWPIPPWRVTPKRSQNGLRYYEIILLNGETKRLPWYRVLHVMNLSLDGSKGISCIAAGRQAIGLSLAAEECGARLFGQGLNPGGVVQYPAKIKPDQLKELKEDIKDKFQGLGKTHRLMFLEEGMKYEKVGIPPNDAQFLETRKFQVAEIGRIFGISQLHKIGDLERATFSNIEHQAIEFQVDTIRPHLVNREQEYNWRLFTPQERGKYFAEHLIDGLLRGDTKSRYEAYNKGFQVGAFSVNDILELENRNPIGEEGDERFVPMNMVPLKKALEEPKVKESDEGRTLDTEEKGGEAVLRFEFGQRSGQARHKIAQSYKRIFEDVGKRIVKREEADVMRKAIELLGKRDKNSFLEWLEQFYNKHPDYVKRQMLPAVTSLAEAIQGEVAGEIDIDAGMTPELEKFTRDYVDAYTTRHISSSKGQLAQVVQEAYEDPESDELSALQDRFDEWNERRPGKIAARETVQINGAVFRFVAAAAGITKLVWRNTGSKTCPFCQQLDGTVVGIEQPFIPANGFIEADDGSGMKVYGKKMHPPIHDGCVCIIEAE